MAGPADKRKTSTAQFAGAERRRAPRARKRLLVRYGVEEAKHTAFTKNVSETGIFLHTNTVFKPGTTLLLEIAFPQKVWSLWGRVAWAKQVPAQLAHILECGMGVHFLEPAREWTAFIQIWLRKNR